MSVKVFVVFFLSLVWLSWSAHYVRALSTRQLARALSERLPEEWAEACQPTSPGGRSESDAVDFLVGQGKLDMIPDTDLHRWARAHLLSDLFMKRALFPLSCALLLYAWLANSND